MARRNTGGDSPIAETAAKLADAPHDDGEMFEDATPILGTIDIATETLTGDIRDFILDTLRHEQDRRPWHERSEAEQRATVARVETAVHAHVRHAVELIAAAGRRTIKARLAQVTIKDGIKATLILSKHSDLRHQFMDAQGRDVLVVVADPEEFSGERAPVAITPDQGDIERLARAGAVHSAAEDNHAAAPFN